jgi:predicted NUDIX family NTP pyrophosphohydrolase
MASIAGVLLYRQGRVGVEVLLVHSGGPHWRGRFRGAWSIPKGELALGEAAEATARREFREQLGHELGGSLHPLGYLHQGGGKRVTAFAAEGDFDPAMLVSQSFTMERPPRVGETTSFPKVDRAAWFPLAEAHDRIMEGQRHLLDLLAERIERRD